MTYSWTIRRRWNPVSTHSFWEAFTKRTNVRSNRIGIGPQQDELLVWKRLHGQSRRQPCRHSDRDTGACDCGEGPKAQPLYLSVFCRAQAPPLEARDQRPLGPTPPVHTLLSWWNPTAILSVRGIEWSMQCTFRWVVEPDWLCENNVALYGIFGWTATRVQN